MSSSVIEQKKANAKTPYWYRIYVGECPMCGNNAGSRERVYGPRPEKDEDRYVYLTDFQTYDGCIEMMAVGF